MKSALILILYFLSGLQCIAGNAADLIAEVEKRTLVIVLETTIKAKYDKLDADGQAAYTKAVNNYNRKLKEVAEKFWTVNSKIEFKTWDEVNALIKSGIDNSLLLYAGNYSIDPKSITMLQKGLKFYPEIFVDNDTRNYRDYFTSFKLCFLDDFKKDKHIVSRTVTNIWPLKEDIVFAFQYIQCMLLETKRTDSGMDALKVAYNHNTSLTTAKLVLRKEITDNGVNEVSIKKVYAYEGGVVHRDSLLAGIMRRDNIVYVEIVPILIGTGEAMRLTYEHILVNVKSGMVVGYLAPDYGVLHATMGHGTFHKFVSLGALEKYVSGADKRSNSYSGEQRE